jgi:hypothetical protein
LLHVQTMRNALLILATMTLLTPAALAGPAEDANAALDRFSAAYSANDVEALAKLYAPNAIFLGKQPDDL